MDVDYKNHGSAEYGGLQLGECGGGNGRKRHDRGRTERDTINKIQRLGNILF